METKQTKLAQRLFSVEYLSIFGALTLIGLIFFYLFFLNHIEFGEVGVARDNLKGQIWIQKQPGWYFTSFGTKVVTLKTVPIKVSLMTDANVVSQKIVRLKEDKIIDYIELQGFYYGSGWNLASILFGYAYSGKEYSFLEILESN